MARGRFVWDPDREVYSFSGFIKNEIGSSRESKINCGEPLNIYLREDRAVVEESGHRNKERIHVAIELVIPKDLTDTPVSNEKLIKEMLR